MHCMILLYGYCYISCYVVCLIFIVVWVVWQFLLCALFDISYSFAQNCIFFQPQKQLLFFSNINAYLMLTLQSTKTGGFQRSRRLRWTKTDLKKAKLSLRQSPLQLPIRLVFGQNAQSAGVQNQRRAGSIPMWRSNLLLVDSVRFLRE